MLICILLRWFIHFAIIICGKFPGLSAPWKSFHKMSGSEMWMAGLWTAVKYKAENDDGDADNHFACCLNGERNCISVAKSWRIDVLSIDWKECAGFHPIRRDVLLETPGLAGIQENQVFVSDYFRHIKATNFSTACNAILAYEIPMNLTSEVFNTVLWTL